MSTTNFKDYPKHLYRSDIDGLRAIAVILVLIYHYFPNLIQGGFVGVDIFFVISGYLIAEAVLSPYTAGHFSVIEFYKRRANRLLPALLLMIFTVVGIGYIFLFPTELAALGKHAIAGLLFYSNILYATESGYFDAAAKLKPLLHLWSLGVEAQFYLSFPLLVIFFKSKTTKAIVVVTIFSLLISIFLTKDHPSYSYYLPVTRIWELLSGSLIYIYSHSTQSFISTPFISRFKCSRFLSANLLAIFGFLSIVFSSFFISNNDQFPGYLALLPVIGAGSLILSGPNSKVNAIVLSHRLMVYIGKISYPVYLWHWPLLCFFQIVFCESLGVYLKLSLVLLSLLIGSITHHIVEKPFSRLKRFPYLDRAPIQLAIFGCLMSILIWKVPAVLPEWPGVYKIEEAIGDWKLPGGENHEIALPDGQRITYRVVGSAKDSPSVLLVGDSHIEQYWPLFVDRFTVAHNDGEGSIAIFSRGGCLPIAHIERITSGYHCEMYGSNVVKLLTETTAKTVVIGAFWEGYFLGGYREDNPKPLVKLVGSKGNVQAGFLLSAESPALVSFESMISDLKSRGVDVYIVLSNVSYDPFNPRLMVNHLTREINPEKYVDLVAYNLYRKAVTDMLSTIASRTGARILDPSLSLCSSGYCPTRTIDGKPIYSDSNHIRPFMLPSLNLFDDILR